MNYILATATNSHYYLETQQMLYSINKLLPNGVKVIIMDNGLTQTQSSILKERFGFCDVEIFKHNLTQYEKESYYFKAIVLQRALEKANDNTILFWLDAKTMLKYNEKQILDILKISPVYGHTNYPQKERLWTDKRTMDYFSLSEEDRENFQVQSPAMLFDLRTKEGKEFVLEFIECLNKKDILTPNGSNKGFTPPTHRQDQSVFSCLVKKKGLFKFNNQPWSIMHNTLHK